MAKAVSSSGAGARLRLGVVGAGYIGARHLAKLATLPEVELVAVVDRDLERARLLASAQRIEAVARPAELAGRADAAVVAVPSSCHAEVAGCLLEAGLHLLVEKPLGVSSAQAEALCAAAAQRGRVLRVGHLERFNPAFLAFREALSAPRWLRLERIGPNPGRGLDVDVVREVMIHDLDLLGVLGLGSPEVVERIGRPGQGVGRDVAEVRLRWASGVRAELLASREHLQARRGLLALDEGGLLAADLVAGRLRRVAPPGAAEDGRGWRSCPPADALLAQDRAFVHAALGRAESVAADGAAGLSAVRLAERVLEALEASP